MLEVSKSKKRGVRLAKLETIKTNVAKRITDKPRTEKEIGKIANCGKVCSCDMCGNPRNSAWLQEKTIQEKRFFQEELMAVEEE